MPAGEVNKKATPQMEWLKKGGVSAEAPTGAKVGDPYGNRTRVARMKTWSPNR